MESAPNSNPNNQLEEKMPWTPADITIAEEMLLIADGLDHEINFGARMNRAAQKMKLGNYNRENENLRGVIAYISHKSAEAKRLRADNEPIVAKQTPEERWVEDLLASEDMQHGLHPEDEAHIIEAIKSE